MSSYVFVCLLAALHKMYWMIYNTTWWKDVEWVRKNPNNFGVDPDQGADQYLFSLSSRGKFSRL